MKAHFVYMLWLRSFHVFDKSINFRFKLFKEFTEIINQFQPKTNTNIGKLERILIKWYRQNVSLLFNQTC